MKRTVWETMFEGLFALIFIWTFIGCAVQTKAVYTLSPVTLENQAVSEPKEQSNIPVLKKPMPDTPKSPATPVTEAEFVPKVQSNIQVLHKPMPPGQRSESYVHTVCWSGETLSVIAKWYTGNQNNWKHIVKVNPGLDPMQMKIGDKILIPLALLKTKESMPQKYLGTATRKKDAPATPLVESAIESDREGFAEASKTDRLKAKVEKIELSQPKDIELSVEKTDEIDLFQPQNIEQIAAESGEVELFQPIE